MDRTRRGPWPSVYQPVLRRTPAGCRDRATGPLADHAGLGNTDACHASTCARETAELHLIAVATIVAVSYVSPYAGGWTEAAFRQGTLTLTCRANAVKRVSPIPPPGRRDCRAAPRGSAVRPRAGRFAPVARHPVGRGVAMPPLNAASRHQLAGLACVRCQPDHDPPIGRAVRRPGAPPG